MNLGTFACIVLFGLRTRTDNIRDYAGLYMKVPFLALSLALCLLSLGGLPPLAGFFGKLYLFWCGWASGPKFLGFNRTPYERSQLDLVSSFSPSFFNKYHVTSICLHNSIINGFRLYDRVCIGTDLIKTISLGV
ncbi:hypothetical protein HU200_038977 [Digitaria exilis]|uniref:NADH:quinone oxidoreductase/Mrp antiporter transmembrane domain-containing protein n=1 Tax=Digitaria exilis TaxID=1010633 RepID=A0A835EK53_9POAL|nr:hypothetical protein HU200_038977 [Digitaria exilis]